MEKSGTKEDLIEHLVHRCGLQRYSAIRAVNGMIEHLVQMLSKGRTVKLRGFAYIFPVDLPERCDDAPLTGQQVKRPAMRQARISLSHKTLQKLNPHLSINK